MGEDRTVINSILASYDHLSDSERRIADFILQRTGVGTSLSFAQMVATRLSHVGAKAVSPATTDAASILAQLMGPEDCVVFISSSAKSRRLNIIMDNVQDSDIPNIITADAAPRSLHCQQAPPPHCLLADARRPVPSQCARHPGCPS